MEQVELGLVHSRKEVQPAYQAPQLTAWDLIMVPAIRPIPLPRLVSRTGLSRREIRYLRKGEREPSPESYAVLREEAVSWAREVVGDPKSDGVDRVVAERVLGAALVGGGVSSPSTGEA